MSGAQAEKTDIDLSERLRYLMTTRHLTVADMAARAGVSKSAMEKYLAGPSSPRASMVVAICKAFDVPADWLLFGETDIGPFIIYDGAAKVIAALLNDIKNGGETATRFAGLSGDTPEWRLFVLETSDARAREAVSTIENLRRRHAGLAASWGPIMPLGPVAED